MLMSLPHMLHILDEGGRASPGPAAFYSLHIPAVMKNQREDGMRARMVMIQNWLSPHPAKLGNLRFNSSAVLQVCTPVYTFLCTQPLLPTPLP